MSPQVATREFSLPDQLRFAELSGDYNPIHVDTIQARRLMFGRVLVHGIHAVMWALDAYLGSQAGNIQLTRLRARFPKPIKLAEPVHCTFDSSARTRVEITISQGRETTTIIEAAFADSHLPGSESVFDGNPPAQQCRDRTAAQLQDARGSLQLAVNSQLVEELFPNVKRVLCPLQVAELLATTRLVGMECPGLHSLYSELHIEFQQADAERETALNYEVENCDLRFSRCDIQVSGPFMSGQIKSFTRPAPQHQPSFASLQKLVLPMEFAGQRALVIGGSRGIGEATAKLLAAGGAEVFVTYHHGAEDAQRVVDDIAANGGTAECLPFDVLHPAFAPRQSWWPSHLYYFATPHISAGRRGEFSSEVFNRFCEYYLFGMARTLKLFIDRELKYVFYPSSVYVDQAPPKMGEYAAAKAAGEALCRFLMQSTPGLHIDAPRLPRMNTDQTASLIPLSNESLAPLVLGHLKSAPLRNRETFSSTH